MEDKKPKYTAQQQRKALARHLRPHRSTVIALSAFGVVAAIVNGIVPYITGKFFDALIAPYTTTVRAYGAAIPGWAMLLSILILVQLAAGITGWLIDRKSRRLTTELQAGIQAHAFIHLLLLPVQFHKKERAGEISDLVNRASYQVESMVGTLISFLPQFLTIIVGIVISFALNALLATVLLVGIASYGVVLLLILPHTGQTQETARKSWSKAYGDAYDAYANISAVKQAGAEVYEGERIRAGFYDKAIPLWYRLERYWSNLNFSQRIIVILTQGTIFILSASLVSKGTITIGDLIAFNAYAGMIIGPFVSLGTQWQNIQNGLSSVAHAEMVFAAESEIYEPQNAVQLQNLRGDVRFNDVRFTYDTGQPEVLKGISFAAKAGEVVAFVGETGVGKSTTVELISGYYFANAGDVTVDGHNIKTVNLRDLRSQIAVVPQEVVLFNASIKDNIRYGKPNATDEEVKEAAKKAHADTFIEKFPLKYEQEVGERGIKLSVGQKQRVAIARAILRNPRILILDEPTSALDAETEQYITKSLEELMRGRTTFIIAHRLSTVRKANHIILLKEGVVAEEGNHQALMAKNGDYARVYNLHIGLHE